MSNTGKAASATNAFSKEAVDSDDLYLLRDRLIAYSSQLFALLLPHPLDPKLAQNPDFCIAVDRTSQFEILAHPLAIQVKRFGDIGPWECKVIGETGPDFKKEYAEKYQMNDDSRVSIVYIDTDTLSLYRSGDVATPQAMKKAKPLMAVTSLYQYRM